MRRRVFHLVDSLQIGGTESQAVELARRLDPACYAVTLGCLKAEGPLFEALQGSSVEVREFFPRGGLDSPRGLYQVLRLSLFLRSGFDVVHTHDLWSNLMGIPAAWMAGVPVIVSSRRDLSHLDWYRAGRRKWLRRIQGLSDIVLANANCIRDRLIADGDFAAEKVRVIYNGLDVEKFGGIRRAGPQPFPGGDAQKKTIALIGNMHSDVKGHTFLVAAAPMVVREFPDVRFVLVGDGERRTEIEQQVASLGLQRNFVFLGKRNDVAEILAHCDIGVLPSVAEGLPNAVLEYMASGLPVVVSSVGGCLEIVKDGETGLLVPPRSSEAMGAALLRLLGDPMFCRRLGECGQAHVRCNFSFERLVEQVHGLYTELLERYAKRLARA